MRGRSLLSIWSLGFRRVIGRLTGPTPGRTVVCLLGVSIAIGVLVVVSGLSLGLAQTSTVESDDVNYWVVPEQEGTGTTPLAYEGAKLGSVHDISSTFSADERVSYATPVAIQPLRIDNPSTGEQMWVIALGIIPAEGSPTVGGMETAALDDSYPFYANGTYNGTWTGETVISPAVSEKLTAGEGDSLVSAEKSRQLQVVDVTDEDPTVGVNSAPTVVMHLSELQRLTDTDDGDQADQILVVTDSNIKGDLEGVYPRSSVVTRSGLFTASATPTNLPFAMAIASGIVAFGIGVAFVATMMGLELTATRQSIAILDAIGVSRFSLALLLISETITIAVLGGILGIGLGVVGIVGVNAGLTDLISLPAVATFRPVLVGYGIVTSVVVGAISVVYPLSIAWRTDTLEELTR